MDDSPTDRLAAADKLMNEARKLVATQEQEVARMHAAGVDTRRAQALLDAYRVSLHLASEQKAEAEEAMAREIPQ